jgi:nucleoside-diphosphate kinase
VKAGNTGQVIDRLIKEGFQIRAMKLVHLTRAQAEGFYYVHKERPFFSSLVEFMSEGPIVPIGSGGRQRDRKTPEGDGSDRPREGRCRNDPQAFCDKH